jgi:hypothetical protein
MRATLLLAAAAALNAQSPYEVLAGARQRIIGVLDHLPNYTCVQTLNRDYFERTIPWRTCGSQGPDLRTEGCRVRG